MLAQLTNRAQAVLSSAPMTVEQIIRSLGGPAVVGRYLGIRGQAVSHWIRLGQVPVDRVPGVLRLAKKQRVQLRAEQVRPDIDWAALK
jgi:DNA-binding transcriptional regulator YdaS (Cro superfamily)